MDYFDETELRESKEIRSQKGKLGITERIETSNGPDPEEEKDIIMDLDEKFHYKENAMRNRSRLN